ncbi:flavin reductase family protein [Streptomyces sp. AS58]|uniref:flavin reductase family protein n=1 Tax=Streptomyces sp. AS58 TaxID=1519489 RepID=UPI00131A8C40|nr:flavin reductase family protein [Streptomyces sp. AS58]
MAGPLPGGTNTVAPETFREVMTHFAASVTVVTAYDTNTPVGCTATAVFSLTDAPPTMVVSLTSASSTLRHITAAGFFAVNVLPWRLRALADRFARLSSGRRFDGVEHTDTFGAPLLTGAVAGLVCRVTRLIPLADHTLVVGEVVHARAESHEDPLVHYARRQTRPEA